MQESKSTAKTPAWGLEKASRLVYILLVLSFGIVIFNSYRYSKQFHSQIVLLQPFDLPSRKNNAKGETSNAFLSSNDLHGRKSYAKKLNRSRTGENYDGSIRIAPTFSPPRITNNTICFSWNNTKDHDEWWGNHPGWEASTTNDDQACLRKVQEQEKLEFFRKLHAMQYNTSNCHNNIRQTMASSGFARDLMGVMEALFYGWSNNVGPLTMVLPPGDFWHYAAFKVEHRHGRPPVCPSGDMFCYFLPFGTSACPLEGNNTLTNIGNVYTGYDVSFESLRQWFYEYIMRPQLWLRHRIHNSVTKAAPRGSSSKLPCAAVHVRRGDIVLHKEYSRKYFPIESYLQLLNQSFPTIRDVWIFTDDANAIDEAHKFHSDYNWMYTKKKRHRGSSGGWENHIPSDTPDEELVHIMTELEIAKQCEVLVHGSSGFGDFLKYSMTSTGKNPTFLSLTPYGTVVYKQEHNASEAILSEYLAQKAASSVEEKGNFDTISSEPTAMKETK